MPIPTRRSVLITGGGTGIGKATAARLAQGGYDVTIAGRRDDVLQASERELRQLAPSADVRSHVVDISRPDAGDELVAAHVERFGGLDALVTAAANYNPVPLLELTAADWDRTQNTILRGTTLCAVAAARVMVPAGQGRIVLISSVNANQSEPGTVDYSAAKAAVSSLTRSLAVDLGGSGVITNAIAPGWVDTPMTDGFVEPAEAGNLFGLNPLGRMGTAKEIADVAWFLVNDAPRFLIGSVIVVDGGQSVVASTP
jgi:3-oxoacyl-[acyl-carrier protein] reductase